MTSKAALSTNTVVKSAKAHYIVKSVLGSGGFGITYCVVRLSDKHLFALKEYFPDKMCERGENGTMQYLKTNSESIEQGIDDFLTEANRLNKQNISHPNIVRIEESFRANNTAYYVMEYIKGKNLRQWIIDNKNKPMTLEQALSVMRPVLQAIALIHKKKLTHLDIKHENIILTYESDGSLRPVIIDFGQSKHYDKKGNATSKLTNAGISNGFSPPEQYLGLTKFTPQADVYALCATMLYLITAQHPENSSDITTHKIEELLSDSVPPAIKQALVAGMHKDMHERTQSVEALAKSLGLDITSDDYEGNVTRLLDINHGRGSNRFLMLAFCAFALITFIGWLMWQVSNVASTLTDEQRLSEAIKNSELTTLQHYATLDSTRAYYPYAVALLKIGGQENTDTAYNYAHKALNTSDSTAAKQLIDSHFAKTEPNPTNSHSGKQVLTAEHTSIAPHSEPAANPTDDEIFEIAMKKHDISAISDLANRNYVAAYEPLARYYLDLNTPEDDAMADYWAAKAKNAGNTQADIIMKELEKRGFYD